MSRARDLANGTISGAFSADSPTLVVDATNNRVGVGTASPTQEIHGYSSGGDFSLKLESASATGTAYTYYKNADREWASGIRGTVGDSYQIIDVTADTARLAIDSAGRVTMPYQPAFFAYNTGTTNFAAAGTPLVWNATFYNIGNHFNTSTYRFTAPVAGVYFFTSIVYRNNSGNNWGFQKNGTWPRLATGFVTNTATEDAQEVAYSDYLSEGDYIDVRSVGGAQLNWYGAHSCFSGYLVG